MSNKKKYEHGGKVEDKTGPESEAVDIEEYTISAPGFIFTESLRFKRKQSQSIHILDKWS